jgi:Subtilase family
VSLKFPHRPVLSLAAGVGVAAVAAGLTAVPGFADQVRAHEWWLTEVHVTQAWQITRGSGVTVAVLDTGVDPVQADLSRSVTTGPDYTHSARHLGDIYWGVRGTAIAALIAGHGHGPGHTDGIIGIAPKAKVLSVRVTLEPTDPLNAKAATAGGLPAAIAAGIRYAVRHGAEVIDLPLDPGAAGAGGTGGVPAAAGGSSAERKAVAYALAKGVVLVAPAGDDGPGRGQVNYPAAYPGVISVGAFGKGFVKARFSSRRSYVSLTAPGQSIVTATSAAGYTTVSSTSAASAQVAGMAALVRARYPGLTPAQVGQALTQGARFGRPAGLKNGSGFGIADAQGALNAAAQIEAAGQQASRPPQTSSAAPAPLPAAPPRRRAALVRYGLIGLAALLLLCLLTAIVVVKRRRKPASGHPEPAPPLPELVTAPSQDMHDDAGHWSHAQQARQRPQLAPVPKLDAGKRPKHDGPPWEPAPKPDSEPPWGAPAAIANGNGAVRGPAHPGGPNGHGDAVWQMSSSAQEPPVHRDPASDPLAGLPAAPGSGISLVPPALSAGGPPSGPSPVAGQFGEGLGAPPASAPMPGGFGPDAGVPPGPAAPPVPAGPGHDFGPQPVPGPPSPGHGRLSPLDNGGPGGTAAGIDPDPAPPHATGGGGAADQQQGSGPIFVWNPAATTEAFPAIPSARSRDSGEGGPRPAPPAPPASGAGYTGAAVPGAHTTVPGTGGQAFPAASPATQRRGYPADDLGDDDGGGYPDDDGGGYPDDDEDDRHL